MNQGGSQKIENLAEKASKAQVSGHRTGLGEWWTESGGAAGSAQWEKPTARSFIYSFLMLQTESRVSGTQTVCYTTDSALTTPFSLFFFKFFDSFIHVHNTLQSSPPPFLYFPPCPAERLFKHVSKSQWLHNEFAIKSPAFQTPRFSIFASGAANSCLVLPEVKKSSRSCSGLPHLTRSFLLLPICLPPNPRGPF